MADTFRLAGLLKFRQAQEDQAAAALAKANARRKEHAARLNEARTVLSGSAVEVESSAAMRASAAARSASRSMLADLHALSESADAEAEAAQAELVTAKKAAASLEKLAERHLVGQAEELLRDEQRFLDELAGSRGQGGLDPATAAESDDDLAVPGGQP